MRTAVFLAFLSLIFTHAAPGRTWTDLFGRTLEADYVGSDATSVTLRRTSDGQVFKLELSDLQDEDRDFVRAKQPAPAPPAAPTASVPAAAATPAPVVPGTEAVLTPSEEPFLEFQPRLKAFRFGNETMPANYLGVISVVERTLGRSPRTRASGLSIRHDGVVVMTTTNNLKPMLLEWTPPDASVDLVERKPVPRVYGRASEGDMPNDHLSFSPTSIAHDQDGAMLITLISPTGNGIFRITETSPLTLRRLNTLPGGCVLQVPSWDNEYAYVTYRHAITRHRLSADSAEAVDQAFAIEGERVILDRTLMLGPDKAIIGLKFFTDLVDGRGYPISRYYGIYVDKAAGGYHLFATGMLGAMDAHPVENRLIRQSRDAQRRSILTEFSFRKP
ncbi:MAG: hypothetical protein ABII82_20485 [Verrucomicrobiota bacterium]